MAKGLTAQAVERIKPGATRREIPDALLPNFYFIIQPTGGRSWAVRYRHAGKSRKLTLGRYPQLDLLAARAFARDALRAAALGRDPATEKKEARRKSGEPDRDSVVAVVESFLDRHVRVNNKKRSAAETERLLRMRVIPIWGDRHIKDIDRRDIIELLDSIVDQGTPIAANRTLAAIRKLFSWALDRSIVQTSPCLRVKAPSPERSRDRILSDEELRWIWRACDRLGYPVGPFVQMLILTGQRRDEVAGATRNELKDNGELWTIPAGRTKNSVEHDVPLSRPAQQLIAGLPKFGGLEFLFTTTGAVPISGYSKAKAKLDATVLAIAREEGLARGEDPVPGVALPAWRLHDLRRTLASGLARLATPVNVIEAVLNHRSGQVSGVAAIYNRHTYLPEKRKALEAWGRFIKQLVSDAPATNVVVLRPSN